MPDESSSIDVSINGQPRRVPSGLTVRGLLRYLDVPADRVAVEVDRRIVRRPEWESAGIGQGAEVEIVHFVGGG